MKKDFTPVVGIILIIGALSGLYVLAKDWSEEVTETSEAIIETRDKNKRAFESLQRKVSQLEADRPELESMVAEWDDATPYKSAVYANSGLNTLAVKHTVSVSGDSGSSSSLQFGGGMMDVDLIGKEVTGPFSNVMGYLSEVNDTISQFRYDAIKLRYVKGDTVTAEFSAIFPNLTSLTEKNEQ